MKLLSKTQFLAPLLLVLYAFPTFAQHSVDQKIFSWFLEERFIIADENENALLEKSELQHLPYEFAYYLEGRHFELADRNKDGYLSFNELNLRSKSEFLFRYNQDRKSLRAIASEYPLLAQANLKYLKENPKLVIALFGNFYWMSEHSDLAEKVFKDKSWTNNHPEVLVSLQRNLRWMAAHPAQAKLLYRNRTATGNLPQLLSWRADHKNFMRTHPNLDGIYAAEFLPTSIQVGK